MRSLTCLLALACLFVAAPGTAADLRVQARYECLWWSPAQMEGLNPDKPPPKETRAAIDRWEYSDPVGVPHPDTVFLVVTLRAPTARDVRLTVKTQWLARTWTAPSVVGTQDVRLEAGIGKDVEIAIPVAHMILERQARRLRSLVLAGTETVARADLPVVVGD